MKTYELKFHYINTILQSTVKTSTSLMINRKIRTKLPALIKARGGCTLRPGRRMPRLEKEENINLKTEEGEEILIK